MEITLLKSRDMTNILRKDFNENFRDPCPNGAAYFLYVSGIISLVSVLVHVVTRLFYYYAMSVSDILCLNYK